MSNVCAEDRFEVFTAMWEPPNPEQYTVSELLLVWFWGICTGWCLFAAVAEVYGG